MITIFTNPRPFQGPFDAIQRNAIRSWQILQPEPEIILFEDEEKTTSKVSRELGLKCIEKVNCDEFGTPLLDDVFAKVKESAGFDIIAQVNTDIILMPDFLLAVKKSKELMPGKNFFMTGRRWDFDLKEEIQFENHNWQETLLKEVKLKGKLHGPSGMDYWVFPITFNLDLPSFVVGRPGMDSWLIYKARSLKIPVIDATQVVNIIHQNHNYPQKKKDFFEIERKKNLQLAGGFTNLMTLRDADWILTQDGLKRPPFPRRIFSLLSLFYPWRVLLATKRIFQAHK